MQRFHHRLIGLAGNRAAIVLAAPLALLQRNATGASEQPPAARNAVPAQHRLDSNEDMSPRLGAYGDRPARTRCSTGWRRRRSAHPRVHDRSRLRAQPRRHHHRACTRRRLARSTCVPPMTRARAARAVSAVPPFYVKAFLEYLRAAGYFTINRVKTDYQFGAPFTIWDDLGRNAHWRNRPDPSQPFFSVFNLEMTYDSPDLSDSARRARASRSSPIRPDRGAAVLPGHAASPRRARARVRRSPTWTRRSASSSQQLDEDGLAEDTIVFYWSDHGDGVPRAKRSLNDSGLRCR